jgi:hypothetical protein
MTSGVVVRYRTRADEAETNAQLIQAVFRELAETHQDGVAYTVFRLEDGVSFVHVAVDPDRILPGIAAFQAFQQDIGARMEDGPQATPATVVGTHGTFSAFGGPSPVE